MGRDHSVTCEVCGCQRGGINEYPCECDFARVEAALNPGPTIHGSTLAEVVTERDQLRARVAELEQDQRMNGEIITKVNNAVNRAGIHCALYYWDAIDRIANERDEYHEMLRSILALCDDSARASLGPDAPLRAVRKLKANHDAYANSGFEGQLAAERKEVARLEDERDRLTTELAKARAEISKAHGELDGLRVSEAFHRDRCDKLEMAVVRKLLPKEQDAFKGCCPLCALSTTKESGHGE